MKLAKRIAVVGISLLMVTQTNAPVTAAVAQTLQDARTSAAATYSGETYADEAANGNGSNSDSHADSGASDSRKDSAATDADTSNKDSQKIDDSQSNSAGDDQNVVDSPDDAAENTDATDSDESTETSTPAEQTAQTSYAFNSFDELAEALDALSSASATATSYEPAKGSGATEFTSITAADGNALILLSHANPAIYKKATISFTASGARDLTGICSYKGVDYQFQGLGGTDDDNAFVGNFPDSEITLNRSLFNKYGAAENAAFNLRFLGSAQGDNLLADSIIGNDANPSISVKVIFAPATVNGKKQDPIVAAPLLGDVEGKVSLNAVYSQASPTGAGLTNFTCGSSIDTSGNVGLIARTVDKESSLSIDAVTFEKYSNDKKPNFSVKSQDGNAGLMVGEVQDGGKVELHQFGTATSNISPAGTVSAPNGAAGGLAGKAGNAVSFFIKDNPLDLSNLTVVGKSAGGYIGQAEGMDFEGALFGAKFTPAKTVGDSNSQYSGGLIGKVSFDQDVTIDNKGGYQNIIFDAGGTGSVLTLKAKDSNSYAGGVFGYLTLSNNVTFANRGDLKNKLDSGSGDANYGGIVGRVCTSDAVKTLTVSNCKVAASSDSGKGFYFGGIAGWVGVGAEQPQGPNRTGLIVRNVAVTCEKPHTSRSFGGAVGCVDGGGTVDLGSFSLTTKNGLSSTTNQNAQNSAGGVIGEAWSCAAVQLSGTTDISSAQFDTGNAAHTGQIVGLQVGALIYALGDGQNGTDDHTGWTLNRGTVVAVDDIASSGEVLRVTDKLNGLISLDDKTYAATINGSVKQASDGSLQIGGVADFARVAIAMQTSGLYAAGVDGLSLDQLYTKNIAFTGDVDLSGTGIIGFMRDRYQTWLSDTKFPSTQALKSYSGTVDGGGHTVTLAIGEPYGKRNGTDIASDDVSDGNGRIYRHDRLGLFSCFAGNVSDLIIKGSIDYKTGISKDESKLCVGPVAAQVLDASNVLVNGVCTDVAITCRGSIFVNKSGFVSHSGGVFGEIRNGRPKLAFSKEGNIKNVVKNAVNIKDDAKLNVFGGAIGFIEKGTYPTLSVDNLSIGGNIVVDRLGNANGDNAPEGGFIGVVSEESANGIKGGLNLTLNGLVLDGLQMQYPKCSYAGGLLGYMWGNTQATFNENGLKIQNSSKLKSSGVIQNTGGLVYDAGGKWTVGPSGIDFGDCTIANIGSNDTKASGALGLLVCRGGVNRDYCTGGRLDIGPLYLEATARNSVNFNSSICSDVNVSVFDEWVASTTNTDTSSSREKINDILASGVNGVVSLYASNGGKRKLAMDGNTCNTWQNKTDYGKSHKTNVNTRYYYNLDDIRDNLGKADGKIDTPAELTLWAAAKYANENIRSYICNKNSDVRTNKLSNITITEAIDLNGYSYYPVDLTDENLTISGANITFHNKEIERAEANNKSTDALTQHMAMHAGLLRNYIVTNTASGKSVSLTVSGTTLAGSVGMMAASDSSKGAYTPMASSGALISGTAYGRQASDATHNFCNITIGSSDEPTKLKGLTVYNIDQAGAVSLPLLINDMGVTRSTKDNWGGRVNLTVSGLRATDYSTTGQTSYAATSLFGNFGDDKATQIKARLTDVKIPTKTNKNADAIFSHASFFNSFAYNSGSGVAQVLYTFNLDTKKNGAKEGFVTYGSEIDDANSVYHGKQLWYYDESGFGDDSNLVVDQDNSIRANAETPAFGDYLPYVYVKNGINGGSADDHEIKVNQRQEDLVTGCGTYGDPYVIKKASTFEALADYVNQPTSAAEGWRITIAAAQDAICQRRSNGDKSNEATYSYLGGMWVNEADSNKTLTNDVMHAYIQSCYIDIAQDIELNNKTFQGLGNVDFPFRGVVTAVEKKKSPIITIAGDNVAFQGFIPYSYGSVIKGVDVKYSGFVDNIAHANREDKYRSPGAFFGGVIGNVVGGDNIIQDVNVTYDNGFSVKSDSNLVPIGGTIGTICGGGVIFRGSVSVPSGAGNSTKYYDNPVIGRVLDGYAYGEDSSVPDNTMDGKTCNYKINGLNKSATGDGAQIVTGKITNVRTGDKVANTTSVSGKQGLLVLSGIIASGAAAGSVNVETVQSDNTIWAGRLEGTNAYLGRTDAKVTKGNDGGYSFGNADYGKVRNADYGEIGQPENASSDFDTAVKDDTRAPGIWNGKGTARPENVDASASSDAVNAPYLVTHYCANKNTMFICGAGCSAMDLRLTGGTYDMTGYGNGYQGLSGRYYTNAALDSTGGVINGIANYSRDRLIPWVATIDGNNATLKVDMDVREYQNDDFNTLGVGALFNVAIFASPDVAKGGDVNLKNLAIVSSTIRHQLSAPVTDKDYFKFMGVGGLAGVAAGQNTMTNGQVILENISVKGSDDNKTVIDGPATVGGFFGNSGYFGRVGKTDGTGDDPAFLLSLNQLNGKKLSLKFIDCSYSRINVVGGFHAGGFVGGIDSLAEYTQAKHFDDDNIKGNKDEASVTSNQVVSSKVNAVTGNASFIETKSTVGSIGGMGGLFGYSSDPISIAGENSADGITRGVVKLVDVNVKSSVGTKGAGGLIGSMKTGNRGGLSVDNAEVTSTQKASNDGGATRNAGCVTIGTTLEDRSDTWGGSSCKFAGGIIGRLTSDPEKLSTLNNVSVSNIYLQSREGDAGIIGAANGCTLTSDNVTVSSIWARGDCSGGYSGIAEPNSSLTVCNSRFTDNVFDSTGAWWSTGLGNLSGGFCGDVRGMFRLNNLLFNNTVFKDCAHQGVLTGNADPDSVRGFYAAGIEVRMSSRNCPSDVLHAGGNTGGVTAMNKKSFVSFSNYQEDAKETDNSLFDSPRQVDPYVTTSPQSSLKVYTSVDDTEGADLYGDAAVLDGVQLLSGTGSMAQKIVEDGQLAVGPDFVYSQTGGMNADGNFSKLKSFNAGTVSTFNANNPSQKLDKDIPVFLIDGGADGEVEKYLNIVTNGGYSAAVNCNGSNPGFVTANTALYKVQAGKLVKDSSDTSITVEKSGTSGMHFAVSPSYDNGKGQITLITVTFKAGDGMEHKVMFPVIVRRLLKTTFSATLKNGSSFYEGAFKGSGRLLANYGEVESGLLTFSYNRDENGKTEYGWDTYLAAGGSMGPVNKTITFNNDSYKAFPKGTQFTLTDKSTGYAYTYTAADGGTTQIKLSDFKGTKGAYQEKWMSELMGVTADDKSGAKNWVSCDETKATVKTIKKTDDGYQFFRPARTGEAGKYTLTCEKNDDKEISPKEDYYLEIYVPSSGSATASGAINGYIGANVSSESSPDIKFDSVQSVLKASDTSEKLVADSHYNTPSTYNFVGGYVQTLSDLSSDGTSFKIPDQPSDGSAGRVLDLRVVDQIDASKEQLTTATDPLYYRLGTSLSKYKENRVESSSSLPAGTTGTAYFYVYRQDAQGNRTYYKAANDGKLVVQGSNEVAAGSSEWTNKETAWDLEPSFDLANIRQDAKSAASTEASSATFYVETRMKVHLSEEAYKAVIASAQDPQKEGAYTRLNYRGTLATSKGNLNSSSLVAQMTGSPKYYRQDTGVSLVSLTADSTDRLGINVDDLNSAGDGNIGATGVYDLTRLTNASSLLDEADQVRYTIRLQKRQANGGYAVVENPSSYISSLSTSEFGELTANGNAYTVVDNKTDGSFRTKDTNSNKFKLNIQLKVNTSAREFANYRLVLTVQLYKGTDVLDTPWNKNKINASTDSDAHSDYITYTLTRVNLKGISGSTTN